MEPIFYTCLCILPQIKPDLCSQHKRAEILSPLDQIHKFCNQFVIRSMCSSILKIICVNLFPFVLIFASTGELGSNYTYLLIKIINHCSQFSSNLFNVRYPNEFINSLKARHFFHLFI